MVFLWPRRISKPLYWAVEEANRDGDSTRRMSSPISMRINAALISSMPGMVCDGRQAHALNYLERKSLGCIATP
jgi:hypothetical protein